MGELTRPIIGIENRTAQEVFDIMSDRIRHAARTEDPHPGESGDVIDYVMRYGGKCRGCADENGVFPTSGLPCASDDARKAVAWVLDAVAYGLKHGYLPAAPALPVEGVTEDVRDALTYAADVRWQELAEGAPFTSIDRMMLGTLHTKASAALTARKPGGV